MLLFGVEIECLVCLFRSCTSDYMLDRLSTPSQTRIFSYSAVHTKTTHYVARSALPIFRNSQAGT